MTKNFFVLGVLIAGFVSLADTSSWAETQIISVQASDELLILGDLGNIKFKGLRGKSQKLNLSIFNSKNKNQSLSNYCSLSKKDSQIILKCSSLPNSFTLFISGFPISAQIHWKKGKHLFLDWNSSLSLSQKSGEVVVRGGQGILKLSQTRGKIKVDSYKGSLTTEFYSVSLKLINFDGKAFIDNFKGSSQIRNYKGQLHSQAFSGKISVQASQGTLTFKHKEASLKLNRFSGRIKGTSGQGRVIGLKLKLNSAHIKTKEGSVSLSGVSGTANLGTTQGFMSGPGLKYSNWKGMKLLTGKLSTDTKPKSYIYVRTESGNIKLQ